MPIIVFLIGCFVLVKHAWKAFFLCLAISVELLLCLRVLGASGGYTNHLGSLPLTVIVEGGLLTAAFLVGRGLRWIFVREELFPKIISVASEWRDSTLIRPLLYVALTALGMTVFAVICLEAPADSCWEITYPSISSAIAGVGVFLTWTLVSARPVKGRFFPCILAAIFFKGILALLGNYMPLVVSEAKAGPQFEAANQEPVAPTRVIGGAGPVAEANCKGHFSTSSDLPRFDGVTVSNTDWATVGGNHEVWQVDSGTWVDQGYNMPEALGNPQWSGFSAVTTNSFAIPPVGSLVSIPATMPWADIGDTILVTDGAHQLRGTVLANTGSALSVLNPGYAGNNTGTITAGSRISLCASPNGSSHVFYGCDDLLSFDAPTDRAPTWLYAGANQPSMSNRHNGHTGILSFASGTAVGVNELMGNHGALAGHDFTNVQKCVVRWVVSCSASYSPSSFDGEWYVGIGSPDGRGAMHGGALLSFAPGFPATGLLAGSYTDISDITYTKTPFTISPNTWYDFIISWTPTAIKYFAAIHGAPPAIIATHTTNISQMAQFPLAGNNRYRAGTESVTLFIDKVEWLYQISGNDSRARDFIQPRKPRASSVAPDRFSRICKVSSLDSHACDGIMSKCAFIIRILCASAG